MSGFFGVVSKRPCITDLFYGTDYHSHLGTKRGGLVTIDGNNFYHSIHNIESTYFRTKFASDLPKFKGNCGIGVISDTDAQPIVVNSHLGRFAIVTVAKITNLTELETECLNNKQNFTELSQSNTNPTELVALLITQGKDFVDGIQNVFKKIKGSCSMLILNEDGIIAARDHYGRTPIAIGKNKDGYALAFESHSYINLDYHTVRYLGPGEIVQISHLGCTQLLPPFNKCQICSFLWVYYGFPATDYDNINVEDVRYKEGFEMGKTDDIEVDYVSAIPDSGIGMAIGYSHARNIPYKRAVVKYTSTWSRSFMPVSQEQRENVAKMKLIPNHTLLKDKKVVFCDDSIVRGTQLRDNVKMLYDYGAKEVHIRISCPPLIYGCNFLNFSASKTEKELITRRCIEELGDNNTKDLRFYCDPTTKQYANLIEMLRKHIGVDSLKFNTLDTLCKAIGLSKCDICTHCFDGSGYEHL